MRAISLLGDFYRSFENRELLVGEKIPVSPEDTHHLSNVLKIQENESLLVLNNSRYKFKGILLKEKKSSFVLIKSKEQQQHTFSIIPKLDVLLGIPKISALEECIRYAVELSVNTLYLVQTDYSNTSSSLLDKFSRWEKILKQAYEQSNREFPLILPPEVFSWEKAKSTILPHYQTILVKRPSCLKRNPYSKTPLSLEKGKTLLCIGPEGGFSTEEQLFFENISGYFPITAGNCILRTPTAMAACIGVFYGS